MANRNAKKIAKEAAKDLHPSVLEGVRTSTEMKELRDWAKKVISGMKKTASRLTNERDVKYSLSRAQGSVMGESAEYIASLLAPQSYEERLLAVDAIVPVSMSPVNAIVPMDMSADDDDDKKAAADNSGWCGLRG